MIHTREWIPTKRPAPLPEEPCPICNAVYSRDSGGEIQEIRHDLVAHGLDYPKDRR